MCATTTTRKSYANALRYIRDKTRPLIDYYTAKGILYDIVGSGGIDDITEAIMAVLKR